MTSLTTTIKKVDRESWKTFKIEATKHEMQLGEFFSRLVKEHKEKEAENNWDDILESKKILTRKQAEEIKKYTEEFRKGFEFRI